MMLPIKFMIFFQALIYHKGKLLFLIFRDIKKQVDCIFCDTSSVKEEVLKYFENKNAKILLKNEEASPDLNKCLYFSLEKISENVCNNYIDMASGKSCSIYLLGVGDRFDYTVSLLQTVNQYVTTFFSLKTEFYIISKTSIAVFLKKGVNYIKPYHDNQQQSQGYSIISICDKAELNLTEYLGESLKDTITKTMGLCSVFFRNNHNIDLVKILVKGMNSGFVLFSYYYNQIDV
jgi:thiamine pyrophosphokinase